MTAKGILQNFTSEMTKFKLPTSPERPRARGETRKSPYASEVPKP